MLRQVRHDITDSKVSVVLFREWCLKTGIIPEHASIQDLDRFGAFLRGEGYTDNQIDNCKYIVFRNV